jgi:hypothetical protein
VLARCSTEPFTERRFRAAALINADGQPLVTVSRLKSRTPLPERVATTDLFDMVARKAAAAGLTFYMFGADEEENAAAVANIRKVYPDLRIVGRSHGYLPADALRAKIDEINPLGRTISGTGLAFPTSRPLSMNFCPGFAVWASRPRADCSTACREAAPVRRDGCRTSGWNGPGGYGSSRGGCCGVISPPTRALYLLFNRSWRSDTDQKGALASHQR